MEFCRELFGLQGRVVAVVGASGLIGRVAVRVAAGLGAQVVAGGRDPERLARALDGEGLAADCLAPDCLEIDVSKADSISGFFQALQQRHGRLDGLVNAAWPRTENWLTPFDQVRPEDLSRDLNAQACGVFLCCQQAVRIMKEQGPGQGREKGGAIITLGSIYGQDGPRFFIYEGTGMTSPAAYALIKGGIHALTRHLATLLAPEGIRVNCLAPGGIKDRSHQHEAFVRAYESQTPMGRMAQPEDLAGPLAFLLSDASRYVTGQILFADGGWTAW